jgi:signal transduction histidine kinase
MQSLDQISDELLVQELQKRLNSKDDTQQQIDELNRSLMEVSQKLTESEALKSHFISNISNELVNPFTSILAIAENILGVEKENWKKVIHMVSLIHTEVFNLDFQLKNIFVAAKLEAGELNPEISLIDISLLIDNLVKSFKHEARRKHLQIKHSLVNKQADTNIYFKSDAEKIHLILSNLISNAIKFSYDEGEILMRVEKDNTNLMVEVEDFGQGISKTNEQIIFDRFKRLDNGINSLNRGHGLGLSIIKALIDMLEGKITFKSELGKGTVFRMLLSELEGETTGVSTSADEIFFKEERF